MVFVREGIVYIYPCNDRVTDTVLRGVFTKQNYYTMSGITTNKHDS